VETQHKEHPPKLHLAALAIGKLKPDAASKVQSHVSDCGECQRYLAATPPNQFAELIRQAKFRAAEQNTQVSGLSSTISSLPKAIPGHPTFTNPHSAAAPSSSSTPGVVQHALSAGELPPELFTQSKYRILRMLGRGGMGTVYEAEHVRMNRKVAIKVMNPELVEHPQAIARFEKEVTAIASLDHPNIARAFDAESFGSLQLMVMEFVPGQTLYEFLKKRGRLTSIDACRIIRKALLGLQHAHQKAFVHRDLKPQNLMLTPEGEVKILDFGLTKALGNSQSTDQLTKTNSTMGTCEYMAPEQARNAAEADIRADVYSLGCTLYYLIAGALPFEGNSVTELLLAHQNEVPVPLYELAPDVPRGLSDLVAQMLAKSPADRPQTPREAADALLPFARGEAPLNLSPQRSAKPLLKMNGRMWGVVVAATLAAIGLGGWATGMFSVRTPQGTIVVDNVPADADVSVDGQVVTVTRSGDSVAITAVEQGPHHLKLTQGGRELWSDDVAIEMAGQQLSLRFEPPTPKNPMEARSPPEIAEKAPSSLSDEQDRQTLRAEANKVIDHEEVPIGNRVFPDADIRAGKWSTEKGELLQTAVRASDQQIFFGDPKWTDYDFSFKAESVRGTHGFKGLFRASPAGCCLFACGNYSNSTTDLSYGLPSGWQRGKYAGLTIEFNRWYSVRIIARGSSFRCYVDDELLITDSRPELTHGRVGLATWDSSARFKDIEVRAPDGKLLWQGPPRLPATPGVSQIGSNEIPTNSPDTSAAQNNSLPVEMAGDLEISGDEITELSTKSWGEVVMGDPTWSRYDVSFRLLLVRGMNFSVLFNRRDGKNYRIVNLGNKKQGWCDLNTKLDGQWEGTFRKVRNGGIDMDRWYNVRLQVRGGECHCFVDGDEWLANKDDRVSSGRISLTLPENALARIQDFVVKSDDGKILLWRGVPKFPGMWPRPAGSVGQNEASREAPLETNKRTESTSFADGDSRRQSAAAVAEQGGNVAATPRQHVSPPSVSRAARTMEGIWRVDGDELVCESVGDSRSITFGDPNWTDIDFTYQCCRDNHVAAMKSRFRDDGHGNKVIFSMGGYGGTNNWCEIYCAKKGEGWSRDNRNGRGIELAENTWFQVHVYCRGSDFYANIDGKIIAQMKRADFPQGCVGFGASKDGVVRFKDVKVTAPDGTLLWEGFPSLDSGGRATLSTRSSVASDTSMRKSTRPDKDGFVPLFNRKDLAGWKTDRPGTWTVRHGVLTGQGATGDLLYTERDDYENVCVRVKARINDGGNSGVFVRYPDLNSAPGWEAQINATARDPNRTGSIYHDHHTIAVTPVTKSPVPPDEWFTEEIIADGNRISVRVNNRVIAEYVDDLGSSSRGRIALQMHDDQTVIEFASVEVKELPSSSVTALLSTRSRKSGTIDLLRRVRLPRDAIQGTWTRTKDGIRCDVTPGSQLRFRYRPRGEYDFKIDFTRESGDGVYNQFLSFAQHSFAWTMGQDADTVYGFSLVDGAGGANNRTTGRMTEIIKNGVRHTVDVKVRKDSVTAYLDGILLREFKTDYSDLSQNHTQFADVDGQLGIGIGADDKDSRPSVYVIHAAEVTPIY
jgi:serine/threonine protein kinase